MSAITRKHVHLHIPVKVNYNKFKCRLSSWHSLLFITNVILLCLVMNGYVFKNRIWKQNQMPKTSAKSCFLDKTKTRKKKKIIKNKNVWKRKQFVPCDLSNQ